MPGAVDLLSEQLEELGWVSGLFVAGSLAAGDYVPGVSDLDLVARVHGPINAGRAVGQLAGPDVARATAAMLRRKVFTMPGQLVNSGHPHAH